MANDPMKAALLERARRERQRRAQQSPQAMMRQASEAQGGMDAAVERASNADQAAMSMMGLDATPTGEAMGQLYQAQDMTYQPANPGFSATRQKSLPAIGQWTDEAAGVANFLFGGGYEQGRQRFNELERLYAEQNPEAAQAARIIGGVEGTIAAVGPAAASAAAKAGGALYNTAKGAAQGGAAGALEAGSSRAGAADTGERGGAFLSGVKDGALIGAAAGGGANLAITGLSKGVRRVLSKSVERPTIENLRNAKNLAYKAVDQAGETFAPSDLNGMITKVDDVLEGAGYVGGFGQKLDGQVARLRKLAEKGEEIPLTRLDDIRSRLWKTYRAAPDEVEILDVIGVMDDMIDAKAGDLMAVAREANGRFRKAELLDSAFEKARLQTESTGSGGNIYNKYKQAVTSILTNEKKVKFFSAEEREMMKAFVETPMSEGLLRKLGKLSPNGNGLMTALNLGAVAVDPSMIVVSGAATGAKTLADRSVNASAEALQDFVSTGRRPASTGVVLPKVTGVGAGIGVNAFAPSDE